MDSINVRVAKRLLEIKAVFLRPQEPFTWASGIKSPIYCDNRLILTAPEARNEHRHRWHRPRRHCRPPAGPAHGLRPFRQ